MIIEIDDLYVRDLITSKFHIINIRNNQFSISPRTTGTTVETQDLLALKISNNFIKLTGPSGEYAFKDLLA